MDRWVSGERGKRGMVAYRDVHSGRMCSGRRGWNTELVVSNGLLDVDDDYNTTPRVVVVRNEQ